MASNLTPETNENEQTLEQLIESIGAYTSQEIQSMIEESMIYSSALSMALQSVEEPDVYELQTSLVIDKLRLTLVGINAWINANGTATSATTSNDEL
jgi:hypothetical protein